jgi:transcriptional regulator with XRE-family HTH domain
MALFFDADWFDSRLKDAGLTREQLARALSLSPPQIAEVWKDQRELSARDVSTIAALLGAAPRDVARHAGISTPVPRDAAPPTLGEIAERLERIERMLAELKVLVLAARRDSP